MAECRALQSRVLLDKADVAELKRCEPKMTSFSQLALAQVLTLEEEGPSDWYAAMGMPPGAGAWTITSRLRRRRIHRQRKRASHRRGGASGSGRSRERNVGARAMRDRTRRSRRTVAGTASGWDRQWLGPTVAS